MNRKKKKKNNRNYTNQKENKKTRFNKRERNIETENKHVVFALHCTQKRWANKSR